MKVTIENIFETQTFESGFKKREFIGVDNDNPNYPQYIKFELLKDNCEKIDSFSIGQIVDVEFNIRGSKYNHPEKGLMYFVSLQAWKVTANNGTHDIDPEHTPKEPEWLNQDSGESDEIPF